MTLTSDEYRKYLRDNRYRRINKYKLSKGCIDCGYNKHPKALCFDHKVREDKTILLSDGAASAAAATLSGLIIDTDNVTKEPSFLWQNVVTLSSLQQWTLWQEGDNTGYPIACMDFSSDSTAPTGDRAGVGAFHYDTGDDTLYIRTA